MCNGTKHLQALEESFLAALSILHRQRISFPVSAEQIELLQPSGSASNDATLFIPYNKKAAWATGDLSPTWQADQLSDAKSIFSVAKLLLGLSSPSPRLTLDLPSQQALATYFSESAYSHHLKLCLGISPMTAELGYEIIDAFVRLNKGQEGRDVLESFFGGPMPLPKPGTSPSTIYTDFAQQRARVCGLEGRHGSDGLVQDSENIFRLDSPAILTRLICCRAEVATMLEESCERQWWNTAMDLYDAFLCNTKPISKAERICAFDLYNYRNK
ncbi:hypothetical protein GGR54DRAFT_631290 [Hypoxylon sp. NC1633]|nr:hypothetical protein GGR54DRAFT_631290 [Hypoxylon sp. NC1633]